MTPVLRRRREAPPGARVPLSDATCASCSTNSCKVWADMIRWASRPPSRRTRRCVDTHFDGSNLVVTLSNEMLNVQSTEQRNAFAQLVYTATRSRHPRRDLPSARLERQSAGRAAGDRQRHPWRARSARRTTSRRRLSREALVAPAALDHRQPVASARGGEIAALVRDVAMPHRHQLAVLTLARCASRSTRRCSARARRMAASTFGESASQCSVTHVGGASWISPAACRSKAVAGVHPDVVVDLAAVDRDDTRRAPAPGRTMSRIASARPAAASSARTGTSTSLSTTRPASSAASLRGRAPRALARRHRRPGRRDRRGTPTCHRS